MSKKLYEETNIQNIANAIRAKLGGSDTYLPSEMAQAILDIIVPVLQSKTVTENGTILPDSEHNGLSQVVVNVTPSLQSKSVSDNGTVKPDTGYYGLSQVTVNVDKNALPNFQSKTVTENGTVTADSGYDGLSQVVVDVEFGRRCPRTGSEAEAFQIDVDDQTYTVIADFIENPFENAAYIESSGEQYIDTGYICTSDTKVVMKCAVNYRNSGSYAAPFGVRGSGNANRFTFFAKTNSTNASIQYGNTDNVSFHGMVFETGVEITLKSGYAKVKVGQLTEEEITWSPSGSPTSSYSLYLFQLNQNGAVQGTNTKCVMRLYECSIYEGSSLVHHYVPYIDENDVVCLYDTVAETALYNSGSGSFTIGGNN